MICIHFSDCEICLPLLLLTDGLIIPAVFVWVDSSHFNVSACEVTAFLPALCSLPPHEKISWL